MKRSNPKTRIPGVLTQAQFRAKSEAERERLLAAGWLVAPAGGAPDDDDEDGDGGKGKKGKKGGGDDDDEDDGDGDETIEVSKSDYEGLKSQVGKFRKELRDLKAERDEADDEKAKEEGKFEDLYNKAKVRITELEGENADLSKGTTARSVAARLNFHNVERAIKLIDLSEIDSEADAERVLKALAKSDPYLVNAKKAQSKAVGDDASSTGKNSSNDDGDGDGDDSSGGNGKTDARSPQQKMASAYGDSSGSQET